MKFISTTATLLALLGVGVSGLRDENTKKKVWGRRLENDVETVESDTQICTIDHDAAQSDDEVTVRIDGNYQWSGQTGDSYFKITVKTGAFQGQYLGWCVDYSRYAKMRRDFKADIFTSYDGDIDYHPTDWKRRAIDKPQNLPMVSYLINEYYVGYLVNEEVDGQMCNGRVDWLEFQTAIWTLIDDQLPSKFGHQLDARYTTARQDCVRKFLVNKAQTEGKNYRIDCTDPDEEIPLVYIIDVDGSSQRLSTTRGTEHAGTHTFTKDEITNQVVISETNVHKIPGLCSCVDKTPAPTDAPTAAPTSPPAPDQEIETRSGDPDTPAKVSGDPHFKTFGGEHYDYHGECDLVLLHNPNFHDGLGMDIHIRTKIEDFWSSVESAAIRIGEETLEIKANPGAEEWLWLNGELVAGMEVGKYHRTKLGGFLVRYKEAGPNVREANIYLNGVKEVLVLKTFKSFVRVSVDYENSENYDGSIGLLGSYDHNGARLARDGKTEIKNFNKFGQEWQVRDDEPMLFHSYEDAVVGKECVMPPTYSKESAAKLMKRRLAESGMTQADAEKACDHLKDPEEIKECVFDVLATQDLDMAGAW